MQAPKQCSLLRCSNSEAPPAALLPKHTVALHGEKAIHVCQKPEKFEECSKICTELRELALLGTAA